jgi:hypothetical protein
MELTFRKAVLSDFNFIYIAIQELLEQPLFTPYQFKKYWFELLSGVFGKNDLWLAFNSEGEFVGYIFVNFYMLPRYLGFGVDLEEVVTIPKFQRKGICKIFINFLITHYKLENQCRKITIKTDDISGSGKLYKSLFDSTETRIFQTFLNKI